MKSGMRVSAGAPRRGKREQSWEAGVRGRMRGVSAGRGQDLKRSRPCLSRRARPCLLYRALEMDRRRRGLGREMDCGTRSIQHQIVREGEKESASSASEGAR